MGITFSFFLNAIVLFRFRILDPIPLARRTFVNQMTSGLVVLDANQKILTMNPTAEQILKLTVNAAKNMNITDALPAYAEMQPGDATEKIIPFSLGSKEISRDFVLGVSSLKDWRSNKVGELLLITDVTEQMKVQAQLLEQQRALASLQEREQIACELHDDLAQVLAFINTQGQSVRRLLGRGELATADSYMQRLLDVARTAEADIRESIRGMRLSLNEKGLLASLEKYLIQFEQNYSIQTKIINTEIFTENLLNPMVEVQLLRIIQEALTNVRKHAASNLVSIQFNKQDHLLSISIQDDGHGFELIDGEIQSDGHFGLQMMRERVDKIGGSIRISSQPGSGTEVLVCVPMEVKKTIS